MAQPLVFVSYSHQDEAEKTDLVKQLEVLEKGSGSLRLWVDDRIGGGADWEREIRSAIAQAHIAILLVSANYLTSDFIASREIPELLRRRQSEGLVVLPVIARPCAWRQVEWLSRLNARPKNGRPIWGSPDGGPDEALAAIAEEVALLAMEGRIEDEEGRGGPVEDTTFVAPKPIHVGRRMALVVGNSVFDDGRLSRLVKPNRDASRLAEVLRDPRIGSFDDVEVLLDEPTSSVRRQIASFFSRKKPDDLLLLYYSGHGVRDDHGHLYLASKDTEIDLLSATAIPSHFIAQEMDRSRSKSAVLILDCCHSGAFPQGAKGVLGGSVGTAAAFEGTGYGRVVLAATDETQFALEGDRMIGDADSSLFTRFLIEGMESGMADRDGDGWLTLDELFDYAYERVVSDTPRQTPVKWSYKQPVEIRLARTPRPFLRGLDLPSGEHQWMTQARTVAGEGAVRALVKLLQSGQEAFTTAAARDLIAIAEKGGFCQALKGEVVVVPEGATVAGRSSENPVVIDDSSVSRQHFRIERRGNALTVTDLGSANGTRVNDVALLPHTPQPLRNGDVIKVGQALAYKLCQDVFLLRQSSDPAPAPVEASRTVVTEALLEDTGPAADPRAAAAPAATGLCGRCQTPVDAKWKACPRCGHHLAAPESATCPRCRTPVRAGWKACPCCGNRLTS
ncbi:MAG TPA: FHA domain-containing protein [Thermoanaerobaculia bacterium]|jgi:hypothetical protein